MGRKVAGSSPAAATIFPTVSMGGIQTSMWPALRLAPVNTEVWALVNGRPVRSARGKPIDHVARLTVTTASVSAGDTADGGPHDEAY